METDSTTDQSTNAPWGAWATLLFGILVLTITNIAAFVLFYWLFANADTLPLKLPPMDEITESNGLILAISTIFTTPIVLLLLALTIQLRKGLSFRDYMGCYPLAMNKLFQWCGILFLFLIVTEILGMVVGRPAIPEFMSEAYRSSNSLALLFVALVIAAPLTEEFLFRGFLLTGFSCSRIGWLGAIIICSLFWSVIHFQYDWYDITWIFLLGLIMGYAKKDSKTIYLPLIMHALVNTMAFVGTASYLNEAQENLQPEYENIQNNAKTNPNNFR